MSDTQNAKVALEKGTPPPPPLPPSFLEKIEKEIEDAQSFWNKAPPDCTALFEVKVLFMMFPVLLVEKRAPPF